MIEKLKKKYYVLALGLGLFSALVFAAALGTGEEEPGFLASKLIMVLLIMGLLLMMSFVIITVILVFSCIKECIQKRRFKEIGKALLFGAVIFAGLLAVDIYQDAVRESIWIYVGKVIPMMSVFIISEYTINKD